MPRGGKRPGAGRPRVLEPPPGEPSVYVQLDQASGCGLLLLSHDDPEAKAPQLIRELLAAYYENSAVRRAFKAWKNK